MSTFGPASTMKIDDVSGFPLVGSVDQEATFEAALQKLRQDVLALGVSIATASNKPREEVVPLLLLLRQKNSAYSRLWKRLYCW